LLDALHVRATWLGDTPNGRFAHAPEPIAENLQGVAARAAGDFDATFCQDPDADRLAVIDERGTIIGEEYTLALALDHVLSRRRGDVVVNCATSRMSHDVARRHGAKCHVSAVGEANVCDEMIRTGAVFGGEGNGGPIDPRVGLVRDSFVGMAVLLDGLSATGRTLGQWVASLPHYCIRKSAVPIGEAPVDRVWEGLLRHFDGARVDRRDGLRFDWPDRWLLVRPSNTEPIVRVIAEAPDTAEADRLMDAARQAIRRAGSAEMQRC
jgi:phosphomannomutase